MMPLHGLPPLSLGPSDVLLLVLSACAAVSDLRSRRVPNALVALGAIVGVFLAFHALGASGVGSSLLGAAVGLGVLFPFFALGLLGAGDVKLLSMIGTFTGVEGVLRIAFWSALAGGVLALGMLIACRGRVMHIPFAVAMWCSVLAWWVLR